MLRVGDFILLNAGLGSRTDPRRGGGRRQRRRRVDVTNVTTFGAVNTD